MQENPAITPPAIDSAPESQADKFVPGNVLAGRYRMVSRLGRGGMGEVWRADDLVLNIQVALKLIYASDREGRQRIIREVRLARQITHPAICRVFDVAEGEGEVFYSMELVHGEDLATLVRRSGRLHSDKVIDIAQQLCGGLGAAHARGILHRDLKPANVLIDEDGLVRITDFGIAVTRDETGQHTLMGTPGYMAPEQIVPSRRLSERTDVYSLGLILYELLVGKPAFDRPWSIDRQPPPKPSAQVPDVDPQLERAILRAIADDPQDRPGSVAELSGLLSSTAEGSSRVVMWLAGAVATTALIAVAVLFRTPSGPKLTAQDTILLADFMNTTGEPVFDGALKVALAVALEQSPFLKVFPDTRVRETLRLMQQPPEEAVTRAIARDIARREGLKALVAGTIGRLGTHYVLALEAVNAATGEVLAREQVEVATKEQVLSSLGSITTTLREKLGESLAVIEQFDAPLAQATTNSLDALHAYSLALDQGRMVPRLDAVPHLLRAIELDPNFAMAQALLSGVYANNGRSAEAPALSRKAFELRDRVSERERFFISWRYYIDAEQAWDKALDLADSWTKTYPREAFAFNSLGMASTAFGQHDQAVAAFKEAIKLDPRFVPPYANLAGSLVALNRLEEADNVLSDAAKAGLEITSSARMGFLLAFLRNNVPDLPRQLDRVRRTQPGWAAALEARTFASSGHTDAAHELYQRAAKTAAGERAQELAAQWTMEDAELHAIGDECDEARREIAMGLEWSRDNFTVERAARTFALCNSADASRLSDELRTRFPAATMTTHLHLPVIAAALAIKKHEFDRALAELEPVKPYDHAPAAEFWPSYLRGQAYLGLKDGSAAAAEFQSILEHPGEAPTSPLFALAHLGAANAAMLSGDTEKARASFSVFLVLWNDADDRRLVDEARRQYARLK